jgi:hypothetical protein
MFKLNLREMVGGKVHFNNNSLTLMDLVNSLSEASFDGDKAPEFGDNVASFLEYSLLKKHMGDVHLCKVSPSGVEDDFYWYLLSGGQKVASFASMVNIGEFNHEQYDIQVQIGDVEKNMFIYPNDCRATSHHIRQCQRLESEGAVDDDIREVDAFADCILRTRVETYKVWDVMTLEDARALKEKLKTSLNCI